MTYSENDIAVIERLKCSETSWAQIGQAVGKKGEAVRLWWRRRKARKADELLMGPRPVVPKGITSGRTSLAIKKLANSSPGKPILPLRDYPGQLSAILAPGTPIPSKSTVGRFLAANNLKIYKAIKKPFISEANKVKRVEFARLFLDSPAELSALMESTIWSDETMIRKSPPGKESLIRCHSSIKKEERPVSHQFQMGGFSVMFWGCFSSRGVGPLVALEGSQNQETYLELVREYVLPEIRAARECFGVDFTFMHDNAPCHKARSVSDFLAQNGIQTLGWPAQSPDMNPIENLWALIKSERQKKFGLPATREDLIDQVFDVWNRIDLGLCMNLGRSIKKRLSEALRLKGRATKY